MSLTSNNVKISGVPKFNGDPSKFPYFSMKFKALIMRLGPKYVKALNRTAPYDLLQYGTETPVLAALPEAEAGEQQNAPPPASSKYRPCPMTRRQNTSGKC